MKEECEIYMGKKQFNKLGLSNEILKAIEEMGFEEATTIQAKSIPLILSGKDVIGQSQTGTGKTAAFGLPAIDIIDTRNKNLQVLILCPTRELAIQSCGEIKKFSKYKTGIKALPIYGGQPIQRQIKALKQGVQIVIGTPGRIMDHMRRKTLKMNTVNMVVLDEADEMLDMGFRRDIESILRGVPSKRQTILFSATMSKEIIAITRRYQENPRLIKIARKQLTVPNIEQYYYEVSQIKKVELLSRLIDIYDPKLSLVFCNTKIKVDQLVRDLQFRGYLVEGLHGDMNQPARTRVMNMFKSGRIDILVATDVAARGIDIDDIEAVFNYDIPQDEEYYVHRIGRTARVGRSGRAFTFISGKREKNQLRGIQRFTNSKIILQSIPTISDIEGNKMNKFMEEIKQVLDRGKLDEYTRMVDELVEDGYSSNDISKALIKMILEREDRQLQSVNDSIESGAEPGMARLFINIGRNHKIGPKDIVGAIAGETGMKGNLIGTIDVFDKYTFVEVPAENSKDVMTIMKNAQIKGNRINIEPAKAKN